MSRSAQRTIARLKMNSGRLNEAMLNASLSPRQSRCPSGGLPSVVTRARVAPSCSSVAASMSFQQTLGAICARSAQDPSGDGTEHRSRNVRTLIERTAH